MNIFKKLFDHEYKELTRFKKIADKVIELDEEYSKLTDTELQSKTAEFKERLVKGETLEDILVEAFATSREAAYRVIGEKPYYVQILGALAIHYGNIAEMKTGEGKTLTCVMPAYLNALDGKGVHIITVNEYLATRDAEWMGGIHRFLGLTVGVNRRDLSSEEKQDVYNCDITYSTNNEIGFDYLRDNMVVRKEERVQRPLNFAIIDEVDSVLIDEARTPLIISGGQMENSNLYIDADRLAKSLKKDKDFILDEKTKTVNLTDKGVEKAEKKFNLDNLYDLSNSVLLHYINQALRANYGMNKDVDYVVQNGEIIIVDQFTGRLMKGRAYSDGLHQAIEAKENVTINEETKTLATITFQNLFRMYKKLSGMTGTAKTEEEEFRSTYNMYVIQIPTNKPVIRIDAPDKVYANREAKYKAIIEKIRECYDKGQPVLVGTIAIETSELISKLLDRAHLPHEVLNAKNHEREAEIISKIGLGKSITIATNMAGRGTDIKLSDEIKELGGLCVIGTERHESRRIDNQLRGRSGRQGDPGESRFYISLDDDLMKIFGGSIITKVYNKIGVSDDMPIESRILTRTVESSQKKVEGRNFSIRKNVLQYDDVMNKQRVIIYKQRREVLDGENLSTEIGNMIDAVVNTIVPQYITEESKDIEGLKKEIFTEFGIESLDILKQEKFEAEDVIKELSEKAHNIYNTKSEKFGESMRELERVITLKIVDEKWMEHIDNMDELKNGVGLRAYAQKDPVVVYRMEGFDMFDEMVYDIQYDVVKLLMHVTERDEGAQRQQTSEITSAKLQETSAIELVDGKISPKDGGIDKTIRNEEPKVGRNDPCPCGSGKKYKNCCGRQ